MYLFVVPQECEVSLSEGERHAGDGFREVERLCSIPPVLGLYHPLTASQGSHIPVQHVQVQLAPAHPRDLLSDVKDLMNLKGTWNPMTNA